MHIGNCIRQNLRESGRTVTWFARQICCTRTNAYKIFRKESINTDMLERICRVLGHNFFEDISNELNSAK
ncbi:MAG: helix-turn-helix domain-containing protein [Prevotella sp.]|nr:helix-turn-helix domain-containing protein [Prevotella sp.]MCD8306195.1 helix-turn-helix domain-containing protein [Prevotella sp.]